MPYAAASCCCCCCCCLCCPLPMRPKRRNQRLWFSTTCASAFEETARSFTNRNLFHRHKFTPFAQRSLALLQGVHECQWFDVNANPPAYQLLWKETLHCARLFSVSTQHARTTCLGGLVEPPKHSLYCSRRGPVRKQKQCTVPRDRTCCTNEAVLGSLCLQPCP